MILLAGDMESLCLLAPFCIYRNRNLLLLSPTATPGRLLGYYSRLPVLSCPVLSCPVLSC
jgi:hypothetical protein